MEQQHEIKLRMHELPQVILMEAQIPMTMVDNLNAYLDDLMVAKDRKDHSSNLVGQIQHGQQLTMNAEHEKVIHFTQTINQLGKEYIKHFVKRIGSSKLFPDKMEVGVDEMWSVHSYAGDYNPIHDHSVPAITGLAATTWTKVPEQITKQNSPNDGSYNLFGASGNSDGFIAFNYGQTSSLDNPMLKPPTTCTIKPEVGKLFIFPIWLQHMVYPFKGDGERRTIAANLCAWHKDNADNEAVINKMYKE
jgi:hypothetical protein